MGDTDMAVLEWRVRQVERAEKDLDARVTGQDRDLDDVHAQLKVQTEQISGVGGLQNGLAAVRKELASVRTAFYALTGSLIAASIALVGAMLSHAL